MHTTLKYSPNFDIKKRKPKEIKCIVFHYTGMKKEKSSINRLTSYKSKVSSNYFIKKNGEILTLVPDLYIAWHAGISYWKNYKSINKYSIGIEIHNQGHNFNYRKFTKKQISSIVKLCKYLTKKYKIRSNLILGHSDIAPDRKKDPGEKFPWHYLSKKKIGFWHNLSQKKLIEKRDQRVNEIEKKTFTKNLAKIGYAKHFINENSKNLRFLTTAFQRRFRQALINGKIDKECLEISNNLLKNFKNFT